jgi:hypothetical protein
VICTNGYSDFTIDGVRNSIGISAERGYMWWYAVQDAKCPLTIGYWPEGNKIEDYFYHSSRIHHNKRHEQTTLVCAWWPNIRGADLDTYKIQVTEYVSQYYWENRRATYFWWWTMWYTKSWFRIIWNNKKNPHVYYNTWCNWVGILWSVYGARKVSALLNWELFGSSVFDCAD